jgi:hypothetical protein
MNDLIANNKLTNALLETRQCSHLVVATLLATTIDHGLHGGLGLRSQAPADLFYNSS